MTLQIEALEFEAIIGLFEHERERAQRVRIDATLTYPYAPPAYLDYAEVVDAIRQDVIRHRYALLEEALLGLRTMLLERYPQIELQALRIAKPDVLPGCTVTVSL